jgi:alpha-L-fucosidase 2
MLMQSQGGEIALLPALPAKYPNGYVTGLKARGGYTVDVFWENTKLKSSCKITFSRQSIGTL